MRTRLHLRASLLLAVLASAPARSAESQSEARLRDALRSTSSQLRALEDERGRWQALEAEQKKEIESLKAQLAASSKAHRQQAPSAELTRRLDEQTEANQRLSASLAECQTAARDAAEAARAKEEQNARLIAQVGSQIQRVASCEEKNARLYRLTREFVERFEKMGLGDTLLSTLEPVLGLRRVELENFSQDFQDKLLEQKVQP
jgi:hypothetical protein